MSKEARQPSLVVNSPEISEKLRELADLIAKQQYGEPGRPPLETTFAMIEEIGHQAGQLLVGAVDKQLTATHGEHFVASQPCPQCERLCPSASRSRELTSRDGPVELTEMACHCPDCRRDFFPSACAAPA